jgi:hypothetical protein
VNVHGCGLFDEDVFPGFEGQARVLVVVRVRGCDVDDIDIRVVYEVFVRTVCFGGGRGVEGG